MLDTGAEESFLHPDLVKYMTNTATITNVRYGTADSSQPSIRLTLTDQPIRLWCGSTSTELHLGVLDLGRDECPYILIGRRLMAVLGIHLSNVPYAYPLRDVYDDKEFVDINDMDSKRLSDTHVLSPEETVRRDEVRNHIKYLLQQHTEHVKVDSFINHPDAMVRILHDIGTLPSYVNQRLKPTKSMLDSYITDQVLMWVEHGKLIHWDRKMHGEWPRYNMPLLPVVTHGPNGQVIKVRVCVDARGVNMGIVNDDTPIPNIQTLYAGLQNKKYFAEFDMVSAFNQFPVHQDEQHKLHITWEGKHYVFAGAPFGVKHLSSHVQRVLSSIFADMPYVTIYVDNLIVASDTLAEHNTHCENFIKRCNLVNILLDPDKCKIAYTQIKTLGNVLTANGVAADPDKIRAVMEWSKPATNKELVQFLSFANYLRGYVRHYAELASPLDKLRGAHNKKTNIIWTEETSLAFDTLKVALATAPAVNFPDYSRPFALAVDSSIGGVGAVLFQPRFAGELPTVENIISFSSRSLKSYETGYSVYKLELNALIFGLQTFEDALYGRKFVVYTDHHSLVYLHTKRDLHRTLRNWYSTVCMYDFDVIHIPGEVNVLADTLSRKYRDLYTDAPAWGVNPTSSKSSGPSKRSTLTHSKTTPTTSVATHVHTTVINHGRETVASGHPTATSSASRAADTMSSSSRAADTTTTTSVSKHVKPTVIKHGRKTVASGLTTTTSSAPRAADTTSSTQRVADTTPTTVPVALFTVPVASHTVPVAKTSTSVPVAATSTTTTFGGTLHAIFALASSTALDPSKEAPLRPASAEPDLRLTADLKFRAPSSDAEARRLVTDAHTRGHFGTRAVHTYLAKHGWCWPGMSKLIKAAVSDCHSCQQWNASRRVYHPIQSTAACLPWDVVQMDLSTSMDPDSLGNRYILVVTDVFTSFTILRALPDKQAITVARTLWQIIGDFGPHDLSSPTAAASSSTQS